MAEICVIGGGPAGSTFAARMAQLGHGVTLVERAIFPRSHLGESLSPGVLPLLESTGAREAIETASFRRVRRVLVEWENGLQVREDPREQGLLVDRGEFDRLLLERAKALGVRVLQPARALDWRREDDGWRIEVETERGRVDLRADFVANAAGRSALRSHRRFTGCRTLALYGYWRGRDLPGDPRIEAGGDAWYWGVPLPDGSYNTLVFVDAGHFRATRRGPVSAAFLDLLGRSSLLRSCGHASLAGPVQAVDATPFLDEETVTSSSIRVGEAALALDPISSSGVQKAIQSALAAAIVANTMLRKPASREIALRFYRSHLADASRRHRRWASVHYGLVAAKTRLTDRFGGGEFWTDRGTITDDRPANRLPAMPMDAHRLPTAGVALSPQLEFTELPCIEGDFVTLKPALSHPNLESPVAYLGGCEVAPLVRRLRPGSTLLELAESWASRIPPQSALAIGAWLFNNALVVEEPFISCASPLHDRTSGVVADPRP